MPAQAALRLTPVSAVFFGYKFVSTTTTTMEIQENVEGVLSSYRGLHPFSVHGALMALEIRITIADGDLLDAVEGLYGELTTEEMQRVVALTCCDAFAEFGRERAVPEHYVERRYPKHGGYTWLNRDKKIEEVRLRGFLADLMRSACASGGVEVKPKEGK